MADVVVDSENKNPKELFAQGVRAYVLQDYSSAATALSKASELLVLEHGDDLHESLGDVYLYYGKALLGISREESEALGDAVPKNNEESSEEDAEETEENGEETENAETNENDQNETKETENNEKSNTEKNTEGESSVVGSGEGTSDGITKEDGDDNDTATAENEDEPSDLQVAWEVLELAKKIYQKQGDTTKKNLAETLIVLGEVSLESENFESAVNDISEGLKIQKEIFPKDSRTVAETYYKLGIAYSTNTQIDEAINSFNNSLEYLNNRIAHLEKLEDIKDAVEEEIKEIKNLIPDIQEKVSDMKTYKDEALKNIVTAITEAKKSETPASSSSSSSKPVTDISHLVKRKRKADELEDSDTTKEEKPAKKTN